MPERPFRTSHININELNLLGLEIGDPSTKTKARTAEYLKLLNLNKESTVEDVQRAAISTRRKFEKGGVSVDTIRALRWALDRADVIDGNNERAFLWFLLDGDSFDEINTGMSW